MAYELVWYLSYGSNLNRDRFLKYLLGGKPKGARRSYNGARLKELPRDDGPVVFEGQMYFGGQSSLWGDKVGVAYLRDGNEPVLARKYLLTREQFVDIVAQENRLEAGQLALDLERVTESMDCPSLGAYKRIIRLQEDSGYPTFTFTCADPKSLNAPSLCYLVTIASGIAESHQLGMDVIAEYLSNRPGCESSTEELHIQLSSHTCQEK